MGVTGGIDEVSLQGAVGRVLARSLAAALPLPGQTHAVMDGFALGSLPPDTYRLVDTGADRIGIGEACPVTAGSAVPAGTAGVVLADHATQADGALHVTRALIKDNIRRAGEEVQAGGTIIAAHTLLTARHLGLAMAAGVQSLAVRRRPRVALLGLSGSDHPFPHLGIAAALLDSPSLLFTHAGAVRPALLAAQLGRLAESHDLIVVVAESLGGEEGLLAAALTTRGGTATMHRAALKPAKPVVTGRIGNASVIGLAGTAYAVTVAAHLFLRPALQVLLGCEGALVRLPAVSAFARARSPGRAEALPVTAQMVEGALNVTSAGRFGQLKALAAMDGFALIQAERDAVAPGDAVDYWPLAFPLV
jgi:molybdopterin molybdotransferase